MPRRTLCNVIAALFSILLVMPFVMMLLDRQLPVQLKYGALQPDVIYANQISGEQITITWFATKMRKFGPGLFDCQGTFARRITDSNGYVTETKANPVQSVILLGEKETGKFTKELNIPPMMPGAATYQIITQYWCNPVQKYLFPINHNEETIHFMVMPEPKTTGQSR